MKKIQVEITKDNVWEIYEEIFTPEKVRMYSGDAILGEDWLNGYVSGYLDLLNILGIKKEEIKELYES